MKRTATSLSLIVLLGVAPDFARAQANYPAKPVRVVYGYAPGGSEVPGQIVARHLAEALGQSFVFDFKPGAGGVIGADSVAKSPADGYTLVYVTASHMLNAILNAKTIPYHFVKDFTPISLTAFGALVMVINPKVPANDLKALVSLAKAKPNQLNMASSGIGSSSHLVGERLKWAAGIEMVHVPYKGGGPGLADTVGGQVQVFFSGAPAVMGYIKSGKLKAIAVTSKGRTAALPDVPSIVEQGFPEFGDVTGFYGFLGPAGLPPAVLARLNSEINKALALPDTKERYTTLGLDVAGTTPEQFTAHLNSEYVKWLSIVKMAGIKVD